MSDRDKELVEAITALQAEMEVMRQIVKMLLVQHALSKSPTDPDAALDDLGDIISATLSQDAGADQQWRTLIAKELLDDQIEGAKAVVAAVLEG